MTNLAKLLEIKGYLSLSQFQEFLTTYYPQISMSYPTLLSKVKKEELDTIVVNKLHRVMKDTIEEWIDKHNNGEVQHIGEPHQFFR